jgi:CDP-ribitol ribitolphosphotransferase
MRFLIAAAIAVAQSVYAALKLLPQRRKIVFMSRQSNEVSRDFQMLRDELRSRDESLDIVVSCRFVDKSLLGRVAYVGQVVEQMYHLATASVCVADGYIIPVSSLRHRRNLTVVQMWHALGAIKKFGYQALDRPSGRPSSLAEALRMHKNYDVVLCGGSGSVPVFAEAFGVDPSIVKPLGLPRVDYLRANASEQGRAEEESLSRLRQRFPVLADPSRTIVLYAPTFRKHRPSLFSDVAGCFTGGRHTLVVKPHELDRTPIGDLDVVDASDVDVLSLLKVCDVVVTDYSAVAFEACLVDKPLYFYVDDIDEYEHEQGLNVDLLAELPQATSRDIGQIAHWIECDSYDWVAFRTFRDRYVDVEEGSCTQRIADLVMSAVPQGRPS